MPYRYRCTACAADAPRRGSRTDAATDQTEHRNRAHHGLAPDDEITHVPSAAATLMREALTRQQTTRSARPPRAADHPAVRQGLLLLGAGVAILLLLNLLFH